MRNLSHFLVDVPTPAGRAAVEAPAASIEEMMARGAAALDGPAKRVLDALDRIPCEEHPEVMGPEAYERKRPG